MCRLLSSLLSSNERIDVLACRKQQAEINGGEASVPTRAVLYALHQQIHRSRRSNDKLSAFLQAFSSFLDARIDGTSTWIVRKVVVVNVLLYRNHVRYM